jgi:3-phosphoshikimate 1-carboxyvinyltransferase
MANLKQIERFPAGVVALPASKSYSHRALICAALAAAQGESTISGLGTSEDIDFTKNALWLLGAKAFAENGVTVVRAAPPARGDMIDCGESGSTLRFLLPLAARGNRDIFFAGRRRLFQRPLGIYRDLFTQAGAEFEQRDYDVRVRGPLKGGIFELPGDVSSQFVSGLLFALPLLEEDSEIRLSTPLESSASAMMTQEVLEHFGIRLDETRTGYRVRGRQKYRPYVYNVEADYSQAAFFLAAAALGRPVTCAGLRPDSIQGDREILPILEKMGCKSHWSSAGVTVDAGRLRSVTVDAREIPDLVPPIAALCCFGDGVSHIVNAGRLRLKESDRLHALAVELGRLGANIVEDRGGLTIFGKPYLDGGEADSHGDHRIAMALAVAAIRCQQPVRLSGWEHVNKSYPSFWEDFEKEVL